MNTTSERFKQAAVHRNMNPLPGELRDALMFSGREWVWGGFAGHYILGSRCAFHLSTMLTQAFRSRGVRRRYLVSTVGYLLDKDREPDAIGGGLYDFYESMVFRLKETDAAGNPVYDAGGPLKTVRYADSVAAEFGHYYLCHKYAKGITRLDRLLDRRCKKMLRNWEAARVKALNGEF